ADVTPVLDQGGQGQVGGDRGLDRPGGDQAAVQGDPVEHLDLGAALDDQPLDDVEAVPFDLGLGAVGQIPASGRGRAARPVAAVQGATAAEDAVDGPYRGQLLGAALLERLTDGVSASGAEIAVSQLAADLQNQVLQGGISAAGPVGGRRSGRP